ncbi:MAG: cupin domain-containing protein [Actinomycetota bacterium]
MTAVINHLDTSDDLTVIGESMRPLLTNEMGSSIEIYDTTGRTDMGPPPHQHDWDEIYVMLEGELDVVIGDEAPRRLAPGAVAFVPGGTTHAYRIASDGTRFLTILSTGNGLSFFRQMDEEVSFPPDLGDVVRIATGHGIEFAG